MRFHATAHTDATDALRIEDGLVAQSSVIRTGDNPIDGLFVNGTAAQRADFFRRLSVAAAEHADELVPRIETEGTPRLVVQS